MKKVSKLRKIARVKPLSGRKTVRKPPAATRADKTIGGAFSRSK